MASAQGVTGLATAVRAVTANTTATNQDFLIKADATGGAITVTLPDPTVEDQILIVKRMNGATNAVTVAPHASETIDGASSVTLSSQYVVSRLISDGTNWMTF